MLSPGYQKASENTKAKRSRQSLRPHGEWPRAHGELCQAFGVFSDDKYKRPSYANIGRIIGTEVGDAGAAEYIRRLVFSALIGNGDMHLKNWPPIYPDGRTPALSRPTTSPPILPELDKRGLKYHGDVGFNAARRLTGGASNLSQFAALRRS